METYDNLWLTSLDEENQSRHGPYWFLVTTNHTSHTAFETLPALQSWLEDRGIFCEFVPELGTFSTQRLHGSYIDNMCYHPEFDPIEPIKYIRKLSNAKYTLGKITEEKGIRVISYLNPNVRDRYNFNYFETRKRINLGCSDAWPVDLETNRQVFVVMMLETLRSSLKSSMGDPINKLHAEMQITQYEEELENLWLGI